MTVESQAWQLAMAARKKRGARGGVKHQPGKGHDRKSAERKKKRFIAKAAQKRRQVDEEAKKEWARYDELTDEQKRLLGPACIPQIPRPTDD